MKTSIVATVFAATVLAATNLHAITVTDTNSNGMSDYWEKHWNNGSLFPNTFLATADPDGDGWNNLTESVAGTNPNDSRPPTGLIQAKIVESPAVQTMSGDEAKAFVISWPTVVGKQYKLLVSSDLSPGSWVLFDQPMMGTGSEIQIAVEPLNEDGTRPTRLFWRVASDDTDTDGDTLSDYEETAKGTNPLKTDTDGDGLPDNTDPAPLASATVADPDGLNLPSSLSSNLRGFWDFETQNNGTTVPAIFPDRSGANRHATAYSSGPQPYGIPSKAAKISSQYMTLPTSTFQGQSTWTISGWLKFTKGGIAGLGTGYKMVYALYDLQGNGPAPQKVQLAQGTVLAVAKVGTNEQWYVGGYKQSYYTTEPGGIPGNALTKFNGYTFTLPLGTTDDGEWHQFAVTRSNTTNGQKVYFDGQVVFQGDLKDYDEIDYDSDTTFTFGRLYPAHNVTALPEAYVDRVRVHSKLLSASEITALYRQDIDRDGLWDVTENSTGLWRDANSNGIQDLGETNYIVSPFVAQPADDDADDDGLSNLLEQSIGTKIANPDTDGDLMPDGWEYNYSSMAGTSSLMMAAAATPTVGYLDPLVNDAAGDLDGDGVSNLNEYRYASDPRNKDTDGDGKNDNIEINQGSGPSDPSDGGNPIPAAEKVSILLGVGDKSGSKSEDYVLNCFRVDPTTGQEQRFYTLRSGGHGQYAQETQSIFKKGESYTFQLKWQSSSLTSRPSSPGVSAEGPDFDYTFKVQPQGTTGGIFVDSYDKNSHTISGSILNDDASNVAVDQAAFRQNYESKRVALLSPKVEWIAVDDYNNLDAHVDPFEQATMQGKRIFPDYKDPWTPGLRHAVKLVVKGGLEGIPVYAKAFDIDDSTSETTDKLLDGNEYMDTNGKSGDDNLPDYLNTSQSGHFWKDNNWGSSEINDKFDSTGKKEFYYRVGMQPGNNYRAVVSVKDSSGLDGVQTSNATAAGYLGPAVSQNAGKIASEPLTVWRHLWVENDSMRAIPTDSNGNKGNNLGSVTPQTVLGVSYNATNDETQIEINLPTDSSSAEDLENGKVKIQGTYHDVLRTQPFSIFGGVHIYLYIKGNYGSISVGTGFLLYDDDGDFMGNDYNPLPHLSMVSDEFKHAYRAAFIEPINDSKFNDDAYRDFIINYKAEHGLYGIHNGGIWDDAFNLVDSNALWVGTVIAGYQSDEGNDADPKDDDNMEGSTVIPRIYSVVYVEDVRDNMDKLFRDNENNPVAVQMFKNEVFKNIPLTAAHELGHMPGGGNEGTHHAEGMLMDGRGYETANEFSSKTLRRFRTTRQWKQTTNQ